MPDREKVIKELESLRDICNAKSNMAIGNGKVAWAGYANAADDALALLKEQDAVKPKINEYGEAFCECGENVGIIPDSKQLPSVRMKFCPECGRAVKWK